MAWDYNWTTARQQGLILQVSQKAWYTQQIDKKIRSYVCYTLHVWQVWQCDWCHSDMNCECSEQVMSAGKWRVMLFSCMILMLLQNAVSRWYKYQAPLLRAESRQSLQSTLVFPQIERREIEIWGTLTSTAHCRYKTEWKLQTNTPTTYVSATTISVVIMRTLIRHM